MCELQLDNPFWLVSCAIYGEPGVQETCLGLQDEFGVDVNLLLLAAWLGGEGVRMAPVDAAAIVAKWQGEVVRPLRQARRAVKGMALHALGDVARFRRETLRIELQAERIEQAMLYAWARERQGEPSSAVSHLRENVTALLEWAGVRDPARILATACSIEAAHSKVAG